MNWVKDIFKCPTCRQEKKCVLQESNVRCPAGHEFSVVEGVVDFIGGAEPNARSWSLKWWLDEVCDDYYSSPRWAEFRENSWQDFMGYSGIYGKNLKGLHLLDAGCGPGHFARKMADLGGDVVGMDISQAVFRSIKRHADQSGLRFVRGSSLNPPFLPGSFDIVNSSGSLHHTGNTKLGFMSLARLVKPGGCLSVWIYDKAETQSWKTKNMVRFWRRFTPSLPASLLILLAILSIPLYYAYQFPLLGKIGYRLFPVGMFPFWQVRVIETIDLYAPLHMDCHSREEVGGWFKEAGFEVIAESRWPVGLTGRKIS